jgi:hypothetical protein
LRARIDRIIAGNGTAEVSSAESQMFRPLHEIVICQHIRLNLPPTEIPKFGVQITNSKHFHDTFNSFINNNQMLDNVQKLHYLLSSVVSEAHQLIMIVPVTEQNLHVACNLLCDRYNMKALLSLPTINKE